MSLHAKWFVWAAVLCSAPPVATAQRPPEAWTEAQVVERFLAESLQSKELRARVAMVEAESRTRTVFPNPALSYSREGAGYNQFVEASQTLPLSGRVRYLRDAGKTAVAAAEADREAALWWLRSDLRAAFYRMLAAQERVRALSSAAGEVDRLTGILRRREDQGEGSRYDRMRAEREGAELRTDLIAARTGVAEAGALLARFLPEGVEVREVRGDLLAPGDPPAEEELVRRALDARADYRAERRNLARYQVEEQAARRLRIPEPQVTAGVKRGDVLSGLEPNPFSNVTRTGLAFSVSVPLQLFNDGRREVARYQAEQSQVSARIAVLARRIRTEVQGAREALSIRREALEAYRREALPAGAELTRIAQVAYEEGEAGILEVLDAQRVNRAANLRLLDLEAGVKEAWIELERVVGEEVRP
jgi:cobalt-zinc-cadmium efflux system outer membrane protein